MIQSKMIMMGWVERIALVRLLAPIMLAKAPAEIGVCLPSIVCQHKMQSLITALIA